MPIIAQEKKINSADVHRGGFTLIETLVYVGIFSALLVVVVGATLALSRSFGYIRSAKELNTAAMVSLERMVRSARGAVEVDTSTSVLNAHPGVLKVNTATSSLEFYIDGGSLKVKENGVESGALTGGRVTIDNLVFRLVESGTIEAVRVEMTLSASYAGVTKTADFASFAVVRGSYW